MPWKETNVEDIRLEFIRSLTEYPDSFRDVCMIYGISRKTGYKWLKRYNFEGKSGLQDKRRSPINRPRDTPDDIVKSIIDFKLRHPHWGAKKLKSIFERDNPGMTWPALTTVGNILKRHNLTTKKRIRVRYARAAPVGNCYEPNDVWTADFKGWWNTKNGDVCEPFTLSDHHSRFLLCCSHVDSKSLDFVWSLLRESFEEYGMPFRIRSDNGPPFASHSIARLSRLPIKLIRLGISPEWITPGKPQENGQHERMHRTLKLEAATPPAENLYDQQKNLDLFRYQYNYIRPHESLNMQTPNDIYYKSFREWTGEEKDPTYPDGYYLRRVDKRGTFKWCGLKGFTSELLEYQVLGLKENQNNIVEVYFGPILLGLIDPIVGFKKI